MLCCIEDWVDTYSDTLGGDSDLSDYNQSLASNLANFVQKKLPERVAMWCSPKKRSVQMASALGRSFMTWHALDELDFGSCTGLTVETVASKLGEDWTVRRSTDPLHWRFPRGESVVDVINRLEPIFVECERQKQPVIIVSHFVPLQILLNFFGDGSPANSSSVTVPHGVVLRLQPHCYGCNISQIPLTAL